MTLWLEAYRTRCAGQSADPDVWVACGRNPLEQAASLDQLAMLLCRVHRFDDARGVLERAVALHPKSALPWRSLIGLSKGDGAVIARARNACPADPEIWLAALVMEHVGRPDEPKAIDSVRSAARDRIFPVATMICFYGSDWSSRPESVPRTPKSGPTACCPLTSSPFSAPCRLRTSNGPLDPCGLVWTAPWTPRSICTVRWSKSSWQAAPRTPR
jgi:hypothetical protein